MASHHWTDATASSPCSVGLQIKAPWLKKRKSAGHLQSIYEPLHRQGSCIRYFLSLTTGIVHQKFQGKFPEALICRILHNRDKLHKGIAFIIFNLFSWMSPHRTEKHANTGSLRCGMRGVFPVDLTFTLADLWISAVSFTNVCKTLNVASHVVCGDLNVILRVRRPPSHQRAKMENKLQERK